MGDIDTQKLQAWASTPSGAAARTQVTIAAYGGLAALALVGLGIYGIATKRRQLMVMGFGGGALSWFVSHQMAASAVASARASGAVT